MAAYRRILVPVDSSACARLGAREAIRLAREAGSEAADLLHRAPVPRLLIRSGG